MTYLRLLALVAILGMPFAARAHDVDARDYDDETALDKLGRGLAGMTTGFMELPGNIVAESRERGAAAGWTIGFAKGLGMIPVRELVGVYEFVTSPIPVPEDYQPVLSPEYPWEYFDGAPPARLARR